MDWPRRPVDRLQDFRPRFCPRKDCSHHVLSQGFRFKESGSYRTKRGSVVKRFRCVHCDRTFGAKAFSLTYYRKRPELLRAVVAGLQAGSCHRQLGRRLFPDREGLDGIWLDLHRRDWITTELPSNTRHRRVFTY